MVLNDAHDVERFATIFTALGNAIRLKTLLLIKETKRPLHIQAVSKALNVDYAALYRHVKVLQKSGLLETYDVGRSQVLVIKDKELLEKIFELTNKLIQ